MPTIKNRITGMDGVTRGGLATGSLQVGPRYHWLKFLTRLNGDDANAEDVVDMVRLKVNERVIREITAKDIRDIAKSNGLTVADHELPIFFAEPWQETPEQMYRNAWDTLGERNFKYELQLKNPGASGDVITIDGWEAHDYGHTYADAAKTQLVKRIVHQRRSTWNAPEGWYDIDTLPLNAAILRLWMQSAVSIQEIEINIDDLKVYEGTEEQNAIFLADFDLSATPFKFAYIADEYGTADALVALKKLNVRVRSAATSPLTIITEELKSGF